MSDCLDRPFPLADVVCPGWEFLVESDGHGGWRLADTAAVHDWLKAGVGVFEDVAHHAAWARACLTEGRNLCRQGEPPPHDPQRDPCRCVACCTWPTSPRPWAPEPAPVCEGCGARQWACYLTCALDAPLRPEEW